jgi:DNA-binding transcriptional ArsR family regulator
MATDEQLDRIMRAVADTTRRRLFRQIAATPGMSTTELGALVPGMSRWGVMKHIDVLRESGLVQTLPDGRRRRHYAESHVLAPLREWLSAKELA